MNKFVTDWATTDRVQVVLDTIASRRSVRNYSDRPVTDELVDKLLRAAMAAPSAKNRQPWEFVVVRSRAVLDSLAGDSNMQKCFWRSSCRGGVRSQSYRAV